MTFSYVGSLSLGQCLPIAVEAQLAVVPEMSAKIAGLLEAQAALTITPPTLGGQVAAAYEMMLGLQASIDAGLPSASLDLSGLAAILAEVQASLSFWLSLGVTFGAGVHMWTYSGLAGGAVPGGIPGSGTEVPVNGVMILAADGGAWEAMKVCFAT